MSHLATNLSLLMELLNIPSKELSLDLKIDPSVVSRWRSGKRRLVAGGAWTGELARYFLRRRPDEVERLLRSLCPLETAAGIGAEECLSKWLCGRRTCDDTLLYERESAAPPPGTPCAEGNEAVRRILREFLDYVLTIPGPGEILFVCPDGLSIFTGDIAYNLPLQALLWEVFQHGYRLKTVLRPDYRVSDVALACGPWLAAHLRGYIQSYYYDDFCINEEEEILVCLPGRLAIQTVVGAGPAKALIWTDPQRVDEVQGRCQAYFAKAQQRFRYGFLETPGGFLSEVRVRVDKPAFLVQRLPQFGLLDTEEMGELFRLTQDELALLRREFAPLLLTPEEQQGEVWHLVDAGAVERGLDHERCLCQTLSRICNRRIYLPARQLAALLLRARRLLDESPKYHLLCLSSEQFEQFGMELVVRGNEAAVAWLDGGQSAACQDYPNVSALQGFCATQFQRMAVKFRQDSGAKLNTWLRRAGKMGLL